MQPHVYRIRPSLERPSNVERNLGPRFCVEHDGTRIIITVSGRERWALEALIAAGERGCTPIETPGPRWSAYVFDLRDMGVKIHTRHERHGGPFAGRHGRFVLRSRVTRIGEVTP